MNETKRPGASQARSDVRARGAEPMEGWSSGWGRRVMPPVLACAALVIAVVLARSFWPGCPSVGGILWMEGGGWDPAACDGVVVERVIDERTVELREPVEGVTEVELLGVSVIADESHTESEAYARRALEGKKVNIEHDGGTWDGRVQAYAWVGGELYQERAIRDGFAAYSYGDPPFLGVHEEELEEAHEEARVAGRRLWGLASAAERREAGY